MSQVGDTGMTRKKWEAIQNLLLSICEVCHCQQPAQSALQAYRSHEVSPKEG